MTVFKTLACASAVSLALTASLNAQETTPDGPSLFEAAWFEAFNPVNALDMVNRVPGFSLDQGGNERGFGGAAGNVLIDGERPSSKQALSTLLQRIPAADVARIELIRGAVSGFDVRGQTQLVNVVRRSDAGGSGSYQAQLKFWENAPATFRGNISRSLRLGAWDVTANLERDTNYNRVFAEQRVLDDADGLRGTRSERASEDYRDWEGGVQAGATFGDLAVNLNAQGEVFEFDWREPALITRAGDADVLRLGTSAEDGHEYELGGDVAWPLSDAMSVKLIGLFAEEAYDEVSVFETSPSTAGVSALRSETSEQYGERVLRGVLTWEAGARNSLEAGAEAAFNYLDADFSLAEDAGGGFQPIPLPVANTRVEELRGELFGAWTHRPADRLTLEAGLVLEVSRITQDGDAANERDFFYPKPRGALTFQRSPNEQITLLVERQVSQLDFDDFATSTSLDDDVTSLGNPELEPFKTWRAEAEWERRFWRDGVVSLMARYDYRQDAFDWLPVETLAGDRFDTWGNVGDATILQLTFEYAVPLDRFGVPGGRVSGNVNLADTQVNDPLTGEDRRLSGWNTHWWRVDFRQDLPDRPWAWGFDYAYSSDTLAYRLFELQTRENSHGDFDVFVERSNVFGAVLRLDVENIGDVEYGRERTFFTPDRGEGPVVGRELRVAQTGRLVRLTLRGTF